MPSITSTKKQIIDFLWEWALSHSEWGKLLVEKVVSTENSLPPSDRQLIFNYFLQSIKLYTGLQTLNINKPAYNPTPKTIELVTLSEVTGVNRLAKKQTIDFSPNITVIYGENATGKSGYGRILKALGYSYDDNNNIYSNIFGNAEPKSAVIKFRVNGTDDTFNWNGSNRNAELENISVFNSNCVMISLSDRQLIVSPIGFHLFNLVSTELNELETLLRKNISTYSTTLTWTEILNNDTPQQKFISGISSTSSITTLDNLSSYSQTNEEELQQFETELLNLNKSFLETEIQKFDLQISELERVKSKIELAQSLFGQNEWEQLISINNQISELEKSTKKGIKEIAENRGIGFYETKEFQTFIQSAENYIKILNKPDYPSIDDVCIYCRQPLVSTAAELLHNYKELLNDKTQESIKQLKSKKTKLIEQVSRIDNNLIINQPTFGIEADKNPIQPKEIADYNNDIGLLKTVFITDKVTEDSTFTFEYKKATEFLSEIKSELVKANIEKKDLLNNLSTKENELKTKIAELKDRKLLSIKIDEIKTIIDNYKTISILNSNLGTFNTHSLSRKTSEARDMLLSQNFNDLFKNELKALRQHNIKIDLNFETKSGQSRVLQSIAKHSLGEILSEGEQKAIALAEFLTELQLDIIKAPVIFDDPVNSLDHRIIDEVARRLMKLSMDRQVVVFTHSILLFNSLLYLSKQPSFNSLACSFYNSRNEIDETGFITEAEEEINKVKNYITRINLIINNTPKDRPEAEIAEDGYGYLRSAIELFVEHEIFQGTIKRYQKNVALTSFVKIEGNKIDAYKDKLNEIFERCCGYIKGHSNPEEIHNDPKLNELKTDFEEFIKIRNNFLNNN